MPDHGFVPLEDGGYRRDLETQPPGDIHAHPIRVELVEPVVPRGL